VLLLDPRVKMKTRALDRKRKKALFLNLKFRAEV
jgi:hypothetical protein